MTAIITGKWNFVDPKEEKYLGYEFEKDGNRALQKRCDYCGAWTTFDIKNVHEWGSNLKMGFNGWPEKVHCGSEHCQDYHQRVVTHEEKIRVINAKRHERLFFDLRSQGVVA